MEKIGKILKVREFDLTYGNKERKIFAFACFIDKKYNNQYIIYSENYELGKLHYGNAHIKDNKLIILDVKQDRKETINLFIEEILSGKIESFDIISLSDVESVEIISFNEIDCDKEKLFKFDKLTIPEEKIKQAVKKKKKKISKKSIIFIIILLIVMLLGVVYIYFNKDKIFGIEKQYRCITKYKDQKVDMDIEEEKTLLFSKKDKLNNIKTILTYTFKSISVYQNFKENSKEYIYMPYENGEYKYIDEELTLKIFADNTTSEYKDVNDKQSVIDYFEIQGYKCNLIEQVDNEQ